MKKSFTWNILCYSYLHVFLGSKERERCEERQRKKSEEYLLVNFPADVRKNLKGIVLPEDSEEERGTRGEARSGVKSRGEGKTSLETLETSS